MPSRPCQFGLRAAAVDELHVGQQHVARQRALARAADAGHRHQAVQRHGHVDLLQVVQRRAVQLQRRRRRGPRRGAAAAGAAAGAPASARSPSRRCADRSATEPSATSVPPRLPAPGPMSIRCSARRIVSSSCSTTTSVLPLSLERLQRVQQDAVVARVQADGRLVEHVAHALQVAAQLRRQADALRLAAAERRRGAVQRQVAQADLFQELRAGRRSR